MYIFSFREMEEFYCYSFVYIIFYLFNIFILEIGISERTEISADEVRTETSRIRHARQATEHLRSENDETEANRRGLSERGARRSCTIGQNGKQAAARSGCKSI
jgi:hypothetical protein